MATQVLLMYQKVFDQYTIIYKDASDKQFKVLEIKANLARLVNEIMAVLKQREPSYTCNSSTFGTLNTPSTFANINLCVLSYTKYAKSVELKPRQGTGLFGMAKRRTDRMTEKPMAARRGGYLRQQRRDDEKEAPANTGNQRKSTGFNRGFKKF